MASRGVNKVIILGRVGQDPEVRYSPSGTAFANLTIATSEQWRDKNTDEQKELTEWHRVAVSGKLAEVVGQYVKKVIRFISRNAENQKVERPVRARPLHNRGSCRN